jgi:hypothetical protein
MLFESTTGEFQQLWGRLKVDLGAKDILVAEIRRQPRQPGLNIHACMGPSREPMNGKGMTLMPSSALAS